MGEVDRTHAKRVNELIDKHGWLTRSKVGHDGMRSAWLLAQHADHDVEFQKKCLKLMKPFVYSEGAGSKKEVMQSDFAYLTDRIKVNSGQKQVFGTQFWAPEGVHEPRPIEKPGEVDKRRATMGLNTLAEYKEFMNT
jgi:hypothetical protein